MQQAATIAMAHETASINDKLQQAATGVTAAVAQQATGIAVTQPSGKCFATESAHVNFCTDNYDH